MPATSRISKRLLAAAALVIGTAATALWLDLRQDSAVRRATSLLALASGGRGKDLYPLLGSETRLLGLSPEVADRVLNDYVLKSVSLGGASIQPPPSGDAPNIGFVTRLLPVPGVPNLALVATAAATDEGVRTESDFFSGLLTTAFVAHYRKPGDPNVKLAMIRGIRADGGRLAGMGLPGMAYGGKFYPWADLDDHLCRLLEDHGVPLGPLGRS